MFLILFEICNVRVQAAKRPPPEAEPAPEGRESRAW